MVQRRNRFAIIGVAGFVARRHLDAIKHVGGELIAALDIRDSVGILDNYSHETEFFIDPEIFAEYLESHYGEIDYVSICTPNYLHEQHCRLACTHGANVICEKPLALDSTGVDRLQQLELETGQRIYPVLQLRYHPQIIKMKAMLEKMILSSKDIPLEVNVTYVSRRGPWYAASWKGNPLLSGGIVLNLGIHMFDILYWLFGPPKPEKDAFQVDPDFASDRVSGLIEFPYARVRWFLSTRYNDLPLDVRSRGQYAYRSFEINHQPIADYSLDYSGLHNTVYDEIVSGRGLKVEDARLAFDCISRIYEAAARTHVA
ncbi:hypothetical protein BZZ01_20160 [Nostocales cyanobacterium HT-58-2]|nr:hypothetical protein BZZ01_20160 [Nostocales cyanobacterium HT-58-2]